MTDLKKQICRLCLDVICDKNFTIIEECTRDMFKVLLLEPGIDEQISVICGVCSEKLFAAFDFKSACLHNENTIKIHVYCQKESTLDIRDIYIKEMESKEIVNMSYRQVCRLCMELASGGFKSVQEIDSTIFQIFIPEINFNFTRDPIVCKACFDSLHRHVDFIKRCANTRGTLIKDIDNIGPVYIKNEHVKIETTEINVKAEVFHSEEILIKSEDPQNDRVQENMSPKRRRKNGTGRQLFKCNECGHETKYKKHFDNHCLKHRDISEVEVYNCDKCHFRTKYKEGLKRHQVTHMDISEVKMYKCTECDFQTKYNRSMSEHKRQHLPTFVKSLKCDKCSFKTKYEKSLKSHQLTHISETEQYKCNECDYTTKYRQRLSWHKLKHKKSTNLKTYHCNICEFQSSSRQSVWYHKQKHKDVSEAKMHNCDVCDYQTKYKSNLNLHRSKHTSSVQLDVP